MPLYYVREQHLRTFFLSLNSINTLSPQITIFNGEVFDIREPRGHFTNIRFPNRQNNET